MSRRPFNAWAFVLFGLFFALVLTVGAMDAADAERDRVLYCEMVSGGYWPDYEGDYAEVCGE